MLLFFLILYIYQPCSWECWLHFKRRKAFGVSLAVLITLHACFLIAFLWEVGEILYLRQVRLNVPELFSSIAAVEDRVRDSLRWSRDFELSLALTVLNLYLFPKCLENFSCRTVFFCPPPMPCSLPLVPRDGNPPSVKT